MSLPKKTTNRLYDYLSSFRLTFKCNIIGLLSVQLLVFAPTIFNPRLSHFILGQTLDECLSYFFPYFSFAATAWFALLIY